MHASVEIDRVSRRILDAIERLPEHSVDLLRTGVEAMAIDARAFLRQNYLSGSPIKEITGELKRSWRYKWSVGGRLMKTRPKFGKTARIKLYPGRLNYFSILDRGGVITAKNGMLHFVIDGKDVFAKQIRIKPRRVSSRFARQYDSSSRKTKEAERYIEKKLKEMGLL